MADVSKITLPNGDQYNIKDANLQKKSRVYITLTTDGPMPTIPNTATWTMTKCQDNLSNTLTDSELYDYVLNGADVYLFLNSTDIALLLGNDTKYIQADVDRRYQDDGTIRDIQLHAHAQFQDYRSQGGYSYDIPAIIFNGGLDESRGLMWYSIGKLGYVTKASEVYARNYNPNTQSSSDSTVQDVLDEKAVAEHPWFYGYHTQVPYGGVDVTASDNGLGTTSSDDMTTHYYDDLNEIVFGSHGGTVYNDGRIVSGVNAKNYDTNGTLVSNTSLRAEAYKNGNGLIWGNQNMRLDKDNNPRYYTNSTSVDCTLSNNGMSSGSYYAGLFNVDINNTIIGTFETAMSSNGAISSRMSARNSGTGTQIINMLTLGVYNNGDPFVTIGGSNINTSDLQLAWQAALGLVFAPRDSCNLVGMTCAGHLTSSKTNVVFYIPLAKPIASTVSSVSVSSTSCEIRHSDGGYIGSGALNSRGTISSSIAAGRQGVTVTLTLSTASTLTNNAPITIRFYGTSTLTFS